MISVLVEDQQQRAVTTVDVGGTGGICPTVIMANITADKLRKITSFGGKLECTGILTVNSF